MKVLPALPRAPAPLKGVKVTDRAPGEMLPCSALFVRGSAKYVLHAAKPGPVKLRFLQTLIGKGTYGRPRPIKVSPHGSRKVLATLEPPRVPEGGEVEFIAPKAGFYDVMVLTGGNGMALVGSTVPVALDATDDPIPLVGPGKMPERRKYQNAKNRVWICVKEGEKFEFDATSEGMETICFEVFGPDGKSVVRIPTVDGSERVQPEPRAGVWAVETSKPAEGVYEDHSISAKGVPGWFFVSEGRYWM